MSGRWRGTYLWGAGLLATYAVVSLLLSVTFNWFGLLVGAGVMLLGAAIARD